MPVIYFSFSCRQEVQKNVLILIDNQVNNLLRHGKDTLTRPLFIIAAIRNIKLIKYCTIQFLFIYVLTQQRNGRLKNQHEYRNTTHVLYKKVKRTAHKIT